MQNRNYLHKRSEERDQNNELKYDPRNYDVNDPNYQQKIDMCADYALSKIPSRINYYEFVNDSGYEFEDISPFAKLVFNNLYLSNKGKDDFKYNFLNKYMFEEEFSENYQEGNLVFAQDKLIGFYQTSKEIFALKKKYGPVRVFEVTKHMTKMFYKKEINSKSIKYSDPSDKIECFRLFFL